jgi:hypothetical protein
MQATKGFLAAFSTVRSRFASGNLTSYLKYLDPSWPAYRFLEKEETRIYFMYYWLGIYATIFAGIRWNSKRKAKKLEEEKKIKEEKKLARKQAKLVAAQALAAASSTSSGTSAVPTITSTPSHH